MNLHNEIMNIAVNNKRHALMTDRERISYKLGHRDARHIAAELSVITEETIGELREALELAHEHMKIHIKNYKEGWNVYDCVMSAIAKAKDEL